MTNPRNFNVTLTAPFLQMDVDTGIYHVVTPNAVSRKASFEATESRRLKPSGPWIPPTDYTAESTRRIYPNGSRYVFADYHDGVGRRYISASSGASVATNPDQAWDDTAFELTGSSLDRSFPSRLTDQARAKAWSKLKTSNLNLAQAWAERAQTAELVSLNLLRIVKSVENLKRHPEVLKDIANGANRIVKDLPNWWLETVFGWRPLLSDIHGAVSELDARNSDHSNYRVTVKGTSKRKEQLDGEVTPGLRGGNPQWSDTFSANLSLDQSAFCRIDAAPSNDALIKASALGLTNPLALAWELTPWSFAIDWALPLGQYFGNLDAPLGWDIIGMSTSCISRASLRYTGKSFFHGDFQYLNSYSGSLKITRLERSAALVMPWEIKPRFKDPFNSALRVGTALSLLSQVFGRGPIRNFH